jgi:serine/threonine-protein kinase
MNDRASGDSSRSRSPFNEGRPRDPRALPARATDGSSSVRPLYTGGDSTSAPDDPLAFGGEPSLAINEPGWATADDQPTRISKRPPVAHHAPDGNRNADLAHLLAGQQLEHFQLEEFVGGGGMGAVFRAVDTRLDRMVAVKVLSRDQAADDETVRRFRNEAQSAARLDHENIARVYYVGEDQGWHFIAFEFIEGRNVRDLVLERGPLPVADAISYILQVAEALAHASSRDVVHRDIKPSNILITSEGKAKLVDMGLARLHQVERSSADLTASGVTLGTFDYISPEQARDPRNADVRSDIYSLGCTFYFTLCGRPPFPEGTVLQKLLQHQGDAAPDLCELNPAVPPELASLIKRMMAKDPRERQQTPHEVVAQLVELAADLGLEPASAATTVVWSQPAPSVWTRVQQHLPWIVPVVALVLCVVAIELVSTLRLADLGSGAGGATRLPAIGGSTNRTNVDEGAAGRASNSSEITRTPDPVDQPSPTATNQTPATNSTASKANPATIAASEQTTRSNRATTSKPASGETSPATPPRVSDPVASSAASPNNSTPADPSATAATSDASTPNATADASPAAAATESGPPHPLTKLLDTVGLAADNTSAVAVPPSSAGLGGDGTGDFHSEVQASTTLPSATQTNLPPVAATEPSQSRPGLLVVDPAAEGANSFNTLEAACASAHSGDVIELRYNGRLEERPIDLENLKLTVRAGDKFHPVVSFRPREADPVEYPRHMITVTGGRLTLVNVALELDLSHDLPADGWSLFRVQQAESVELENCSLTIGNATGRQRVLHAEVSFFEVGSAPGQVAGAAMPIEPLSIELANCVARGEADFLRSEDLQPCSLVWNNGLLVTTERLLVAVGSRAAPATGRRLHLDLRHLTAVVRAGFCMLTNTVDGPQQLDAVIQCTNSILLVDDNAALIEQTGIDTVDAFRKRVRWESERNFYDGFHIFWKIRGQSSLEAPQEMTLSAWRAFWQGQEKSWGRVLWRQLPDPSRPLHQHTTVDYALDNSVAENAAIRGATDGRDAGCEASLLPVLPAPVPAGGRSAQSSPSTGGVLR